MLQKGDRKDLRTVEPAFGRVRIVLSENNSLVRSHVAHPVPPVIGVGFQIQCFGSAHRRDLIHGYRIVIVVDGGGVEYGKGESFCRVDSGSPETCAPSDPHAIRVQAKKGPWSPAVLLLLTS